MPPRREFLISLVSAARSFGQKNSMFADAEAYELFMGRWSRLVAAPLVDFAGIPRSGMMLDVGSGTGSLSQALAARGPQIHVVGIDPSSEYIAYANSRNAAPGRVTFEVGDAQKLRFPNAHFDACLSLLVFNFIPDARKALLELRRTTKSGGRISAAVWDYGAGMRMLRVFWDAAVSLDPQAEKRDEKHMKLCRLGELSALWREAGLEDVHEQPIDITQHFRSFADFWDPFLVRQGPAGAYTGTRTAAQLPALREAVKRRLSITAENKPFDLASRVWAVRGTVPKA